MSVNTPLVTMDPELMGGKPCFPGTRVPVQMLFDSLAYGRTVDYFVDQYRSVTKDQVLAVLEEAGRLMRATATRIVKLEVVTA